MAHTTYTSNVQENISAIKSNGPKFKFKTYSKRRDVFVRVFACHAKWTINSQLNLFLFLRPPPLIFFLFFTAWVNILHVLLWLKISHNFDKYLIQFLWMARASCQLAFDATRRCLSTPFIRVVWLCTSSTIQYCYLRVSAKIFERTSKYEIHRCTQCFYFVNFHVGLLLFYLVGDFILFTFVRSITDYIIVEWFHLCAKHVFARSFFPPRTAPRRIPFFYSRKTLYDCTLSRAFTFPRFFAHGLQLRLLHIIIFARNKNSRCISEICVHVQHSFIYFNNVVCNKRTFFRFSVCIENATVSK